MKSDLSSLKNLHDVVAPAEVSWWPLALGWYFLGALVLFSVLWFGWNALKRWRANAYRRAALNELAEALSDGEVATILRRTALAVADREQVAVKSGADWIDWLDSALPVPMEAEVRDQLAEGIYRSQPGAPASESLRAFAARWIRFHSVVERPVATGVHPDKTAC
ncbi:MAG: DUF4381 domain-containing protein [Verrucomicrobiota bacterium]